MRSQKYFKLLAGTNETNKTEKFNNLSGANSYANFIYEIEKLSRNFFTCCFRWGHSINWQIDFLFGDEKIVCGFQVARNDQVSYHKEGRGGGRGGINGFRINYHEISDLTFFSFFFYILVASSAQKFLPERIAFEEGNFKFWCAVEGNI